MESAGDLTNNTARARHDERLRHSLSAFAATPPAEGPRRRSLVASRDRCPLTMLATWILGRRRTAVA